MNLLSAAEIDKKHIKIPNIYWNSIYGILTTQYVFFFNTDYKTLFYLLKSKINWNSNTNEHNMSSMK